MSLDADGRSILRHLANGMREAMVNQLAQTYDHATCVARAEQHRKALVEVREANVVDLKAAAQHLTLGEFWLEVSEVSWHLATPADSSPTDHNAA